MKKILLYFIAVMAFASCSDDLAVTPSQYVSQEDLDKIAAKDPDKVLKGVESAIYTRFANFFEKDHTQAGQKGFDMTFGMMGNDLPLILQHSQNWYDYTIDYRGESYIHTAFFWNLYYNTVADVNSILKTIKATGDESALSNDSKNYKARALTIRAFCYFHLANIYQFPYSEANKNLMCVPISTEDNLGVYQARASLSKVYEFINQDLTDAMRLFEATSYSPTASRTDVDGSVAALIKARVAMILGNWEEAKSMAAKVLSSYTLLAKTEVQNGFNSVDNISSIMWGFKMTADNATGFASFASQMDPYMSGYAGLWAERPIFSYLYETIPTTDVRRKWWLNKVDNPNPKPTAAYPCVLPNIPGALASGIKPRAEYVSVKFFSRNGKFENTDLMFMRAEEAVFIQAEAMAQNNEISLAKSTLKTWVNTYRDAAYDITQADKADVVKEIIRQKRIEMWMEGGLEYLDNRRLGYPIDRADIAGNPIKSNHLSKLKMEQTNKALVYQLPRKAVLANTEIGEANQNE